MSSSAVADRPAEPAAKSSSRRKPSTVLAAASLVLALDLVTKWMASVTLEIGRSVPILGDLLRLTLVHNSGAAFGLFPGRGTAFVFFSIAAIGVILLLVWRLPARSRTELLALGAILGGALGNLQDRLRVGFVIDFIDIGFGHLRWPVFNVADMAVTLGVLVLLFGVARRPVAS